MGDKLEMAAAKLARRQRGQSKGKPLIDYKLADLGARLKELTIERDKLNAEIRAIQFEQDCRCAEIQAEQNLDWIDMGDHRMVMLGSPYKRPPGEFQAEVLQSFAAALNLNDRGTLDRLYSIAIRSRCQFTNWESPYGEDVETAYRRRCAELDARESEAS